MRKIGFIGAYDKTDCMIYIAKILTALGNRVIVVDTTITQKAKYIIPAISPTIAYVTEFEDIEVAVGFSSFSEIKEYLGLSEKTALSYDIAMIDIDSIEAFEAFDMKTAEKNYFVTSADLYSLRKGLEVLSALKEPIPMTKVFFSKEMSQEEDDYLNFLSSTYKVRWEKEKIFFPLETADQQVIMENQRVAKVKLKELSNEYKGALLYLTEEISGKASTSELKRVFRNIEKGV